MAMMVRTHHPPISLKSNDSNNQRISGLRSRIPIMQHKNPPMLVALRKPSVSDLTSLKDPSSDSTAQFSIRRVERVNSKGKRVDQRQQSDSYEARQQEVARKTIRALSSLSLENNNNILYRVRDSKELHHAKLASSTSQNHIVEKSMDQAEMLYREIQHPKAFKHPSPNKKPILPTCKKKKTYSEMYIARQQLLDSGEKEMLRRKHQDMITKQQRHFKGSVTQMVEEVPHPTFPQTLPSAMYSPPENAAEFPALYSVSPLPPISNKASPGSKLSSAKPADVEELPKEGYSAPKRKITYKPYTMKDPIARLVPNRAGGLGPDTENTHYKLKLEKANRQIEYANKIRNDHKKQEFPKRIKSNVTCPPLSKANIAKRYAQSLPALKPGKPRRELKPLYSISPNKESTLLQEEILQERVRTHMEHRRILEELDKL